MKCSLLYACPASLLNLTSACGQSGAARAAAQMEQRHACGGWRQWFIMIIIRVTIGLMSKHEHAVILTAGQGSPSTGHLYIRAGYCYASLILGGTRGIH